MIHAASASRAALALAELEQPRAHARAQLARGLVGEGDREDLVGAQAVLDDRAHEALDEHRGLARARVGRQQERRRRGARSASACSAVNARRHADAASQRQIEGARSRRRRRTSSGRGSSAPERMPRTASSAASSTSCRRASNSVGREAVACRRWRGRDRRRRAAGRAGAGRRAAERLVEAADRLEAEQLRQREHVEPDLQARVLEPLGLRRRALALVVVDDRLGAVRR